VLLGIPGEPRRLSAQNHCLGRQPRGMRQFQPASEDLRPHLRKLSITACDLPRRFADLTLVTLSERAGCCRILSLAATISTVRFRREPFLPLSSDRPELLHPAAAIPRPPGTAAKALSRGWTTAFGCLGAALNLRRERLPGIGRSAHPAI